MTDDDLDHTENESDDAAEDDDSGKNSQPEQSLSFNNNAMTNGGGDRTRQASSNPVSQEMLGDQDPEEARFMERFAVYMQQQGFIQRKSFSSRTAKTKNDQEEAGGTSG